MPRAFDGEREFTLMPRTRSDFAAWANLATIRQIATELIGIFVINEFVFVFAVNADSSDRWTKAALLTVASAVASAAIITRTARTARTAA